MEAAILKKMGLNLKDTEAKAILTKYRQERQSTNDSSFNQEKFILDLNKGLDMMKTSRKANEDDLHRPDMLEGDITGPQDISHGNKRAKEGTGTISSIKGNVHDSYFMKVILFIKKAILARSVSMRGENVFRNSFRLLSECRSPLLTRSQLKGACQYRLNVALTDKQINLVFNELDPMNLGTLKTRQLISVMFPNQDDGSGKFGMSLEIPIEIRKKVENQMQSWVKNQDAHVTYDHKFSGLTAPDKGSAIHLSSIQELEAKILDKIFERSHLGANMIQSLIRYFSDARDKSDKGGISRDQMRYTLWKTFQLNVADSDIEKLFRKYDTMRSGKIPMDIFIDAIIKGHALNEPLLEDPTKATNSKLLRTGLIGDQSSTIKSKDLQEFLQFLRKKIRDLINQTGRAPHYLLQCKHCNMVLFICIYVYELLLVTCTRSILMYSIIRFTHPSNLFHMLPSENNSNPLIPLFLTITHSHR
jgi:Ca2+-binding EF-hand superfamily protein